MAVDASELHAFGKKHRKGSGHRRDLFEVRDTIENRPSAPAHAKQREQLISGVLWGAVGVMVIAIVVGGFWLVTSSAPAETAVAATETPAPQEMRETPSSRETLTRMGITGTRIISARPSTATTPALRSSFAGWNGLEAVMDRRGDVIQP